MYSSPLIQPADLEVLMRNEDLVILDATIDKVGQAAHQLPSAFIPQSLFFDIEGKFSDPHSGLPHTMVAPETFQQEVRALGINQGSIVVVYDRWGVYSSPRAWWMFRYMGHAQTYVLNGGLPAWQQHHPTTSRHATATTTGNFSARPVASWHTDKDAIIGQLTTGAFHIIDARSAGRFAGSAPEPRPGLSSGHIPGSSNVPFDTVLGGAFYRDAEQLSEILAPHLSTTTPNVFTCGSGITAAIIALAAYHTGNENISVYDGSWVEWAADKTTPIQTS